MYQSNYGINSNKFITGVFEWTQEIIKSLVILCLVITHLFTISIVSGSSMLQTLFDKDILILAKAEPKKGDIVVIHNPGSLDKNIIKRIIAQENDSIKIDSEKNQVFVNGELLKEDYAYVDSSLRTITPEWNIPTTIPEGYVFVMGDNRNGSSDSRSKLVKLIDKKDITGKVVLRIWPFNRLTSFFS